MNIYIVVLFLFVEVFVLWNLSRGDDFLSGFSVRHLHRLYFLEKNAKAKLRLLCAIHRKKGKSLDDIATILDRPRRTIHSWLTRFQERGIVAKNSVKQSGRPPLLSLKQRQKLLIDLKRGPLHNPSGLWSTKEVKSLLKKKYGIDFVNQHVWRMLIACGFSLQRPRKRHYLQPQKAELDRFKKKREEKSDTIVRKDLLSVVKTKQLSD